MASEGVLLGFYVLLNYTILAALEGHGYIFIVYSEGLKKESLFKTAF